MHVFSAHKVNEFRLGFNWIKTSRVQENSDQNISAGIGISRRALCRRNEQWRFAAAYFQRCLHVGQPNFSSGYRKQKTLQISNTFTLIAGNNTWKLGGEVRPERFSIYEPADPRGTMSFTHVYTDNAGDPGTGGNSLATLLTGQPSGGNINNLNNIDYYRHTYALFAQDDWRVLPKLTVNLGSPLRVLFARLLRARCAGQFQSRYRIPRYSERQ